MKLARLINLCRKRSERRKVLFLNRQNVNKLFDCDEEDCIRGFAHHYVYNGQMIKIDDKLKDSEHRFTNGEW